MLIETVEANLSGEGVNSMASSLRSSIGDIHESVIKVKVIMKDLTPFLSREITKNAQLSVDISSNSS